VSVQELGVEVPGMVPSSKRRVVAAVEHKKPESISVIFPAFNEEANIERSVTAARRAMSRFFAADKIEIVVVDDGSTDSTRKVLERLSAEHPDVRPIHHAKNKGYGAALRTGLYAARNDLVFFSDADLQFDLEEIEHLLAHIEDHEIVAGYRGKRADPLQRRINAWGWNMLVRSMLGVTVRDIDCAFKLFRRDIFQTIQLSSVGAMINTELLALAAQQKMRVKEVRVSHYPRQAGTQTGANLKVIAKAFRELFAMHGRLRRPGGLSR
jgi:glycosyltransferase involved in cell wall biosynthesis